MDRLLKFSDLVQMMIEKYIDDISVYNNEWSADHDLDSDLLFQLRELATVQSIGSSTRIEGSSLTDEEVNSLLQGMQTQKLKTRDEEEVAGYFHTLELVLNDFEGIPINANYVRGLHKELLQFSSKDRHHLGNYKQLTNRVVATMKDGTQRTIFKTTEPMFVDQEMTDLFEWYNSNKSGDKYHPLIVIGAFIYEFLTIHPFQDGNGRLKLKKDGDDSVEPGMLKEPTAFPYLSIREERVLQYFDNNPSLSVKEVDERVREVSRSTVKNDLRKLTEHGLLERRGRGRGTVYVRKRN